MGLGHMRLAFCTNSVVDVDLGVVVPGEELLRLEPEGEFAGGGLDGVRAVDDVAERGEMTNTHVRISQFLG